jgi:hypothetical protein
MFICLVPEPELYLFEVAKKFRSELMSAFGTKQTSRE